jgi:hypothetical protein
MSTSPAGGHSSRLTSPLLKARPAGRHWRAPQQGPNPGPIPQASAAQRAGRDLNSLSAANLLGIDESPALRGKRDSAVRWDVPPGRRARHCLGIREKGGRRQRRRDARRSGEGGLRRSARSPALLHRPAVRQPSVGRRPPGSRRASTLAERRSSARYSENAGVNLERDQYERAIGLRDQPGVSRCFRLDEAGRSSSRCRLPPRLLTHCRAATGSFPRPISQPGSGDRRSIRLAAEVMKLFRWCRGRSPRQAI